MGLRERKKEQTRSRILQQAESLFRERGFEHTSIRSIAARVPVSVQTLYNYFPSKEGVLAAIAADRFHAMAGGAETLRVEYLEDPNAEGDPVERYLKLVRWGLRGLAKDREFMRLVFLHARDLLFGDTPSGTGSSHGEDELRERQRENDQVLVRMFEGMQKSGALRDDISAVEMSQLYVLIFSERVARWLRDPQAPLEQLEASVIGGLEIVFRGLRPGATDDLPPSEARPTPASRSST